MARVVSETPRKSGEILMANQPPSVTKIKSEQQLFMRCMEQLLHFVYSMDWTSEGYTSVELRAGDFWRPDRKGHMPNSQHYDRCAGDLILDVDGVYIQDSFHPVYLRMGTFWEAMDPKCRWGGRFRPPD